MAQPRGPTSKRRHPLAARHSAQQPSMVLTAAATNAGWSVKRVRGLASPHCRCRQRLGDRTEAPSKTAGCWHRSHSCLAPSPAHRAPSPLPSFASSVSPGSQVLWQLGASPALRWGAGRTGESFRGWRQIARGDCCCCAPHLSTPQQPTQPTSSSCQLTSCMCSRRTPCVHTPCTASAAGSRRLGGGTPPRCRCRATQAPPLPLPARPTAGGTPLHSPGSQTCGHTQPPRLSNSRALGR